MIALLNLVLTLNVLATVLIILLMIAIFIFSRSFSRGWLFLLGITLLFPTIKLGSGISLFDILLALISIIGMLKLALTDKKILKNKLTFPFFLLFLVSFSYLFFSLAFGLAIKSMTWKIILNMTMIWFLLVGFQYFFQTQKRIKRFFIVLISVAIIHSVFGILMYLGGWQTSIGMGISSGTNQHLIFDQNNYQINGFLGIGLEDEIGANPLPSFLVVSIISTLGLMTLNRQQEKVLVKKKVGRKRKTRFLDGLQKVRRFRGKLKNRKLFRYRIWMLGLALIQLIALFLTFSYSSLVFLGIGVMVMGILIKEKKFITSAMIYLVFLTVIFPSMHSSIEIISGENLTRWFNSLEAIKSNWILGNNVSPTQKGLVSIHNSYLLLWGTYGLLGLLIFIRVLWSYFQDIYKKYQSTEKGERVWFVVVASCFVALLLEGLTGNVLIFGPTAVVFWLMYGIILNLGKASISERFKKIKYIF